MFQLGEERFELVQSLYVANVTPRLRELETPDKDQQKRWIWELIQNAKDCSKESQSYIKNPEKLPYIREKQSVDIKIIYDKSQNLVIFKHNGFPFTTRTLDSLMYKTSSKEGEEENTGRFGTGFMTSHTLSKVVPIHAPFYSYKQGNWEISYIEATVYRKGSTKKQLCQEFIEMEKSKKSFIFDPNNEEHKWTTFTYKLTNELGFQSAELGINSFRQNIMEVLLFCDEINSIQLNDEEPIFSSAVSSNSSLTQFLIRQHIFKSAHFIIKTVNYKGKRDFFIASVEEPNEEFSKKYSKFHDKKYTEKKLKFTIAFEIDSSKKIICYQPDKICLFCTFPLIGSEKYQIPFLLNSPQFETFTERNGIILEGDEYDDDNILTNTGLNMLILNSSIQLFEIVLDYLIQNNFSNFTSFSNGMIFDEKTLESMKPFLSQFRFVLEESKIIHNSSNVPMKLKEILILDFNNVKNPQQFHDLASKLFTNVATFEECNQWQKRTWETISLLNVDTFVNCISQIDKNKKLQKSNSLNLIFSKDLFTNGLESLQNKDFDFLNEFYTFLLNEENPKHMKMKDNSIFYKCKIVLNSNNKFTFLYNLKSNAGCSKDFNTIMGLCPLWTSKIIHPKITSFQTIIQKVAINDAVQEINSILDNDKSNIQFLLSFVRYTLKENDHRMKMYQVAKLFYEDDVPSEIELNDVDERIWNSIDSLLLKHINEQINKRKDKKTKKSLEILNYFYELYQKFNSNNNFLIPNFNLVFVERKKLGLISNEIDQSLLKAISPFIDLSSYAHPLITSVSFQNVYNLQKLIKTINSDNFFTQNGVVMDERLLSVLSIIPPESNQRLFNFQMKIRELAQLFFCSDIKMIPTTIVNELFWKRANEIVLDAIEDNLNQHQNIDNLKEMLVKDEETIFNNLNLYYEILSIETVDRQRKAMVPNYKGSFLPANKIRLSKGISEELFDLYNVVQTKLDIRENYAHPNVKCNFLNVIDFKQFINSICEGLTDYQLVNDYKILQAISNLNINRSNDNSNSNENEILLRKLYVANIKNRLNEIQNPTDNDKVRWPWELIQNAKDSLISPSNTMKQEQVQIFIEMKTDIKNKNKCNEIKFSHNGPPFTDNSFIGLLYKISQEKDNKETTGKFGTGFVSTHVLSKVVDIKGNRIDKEGKIYGFSVTMYRKGTEDHDIIKDFNDMQNSQKTFSDPFSLTEFTYKIESESVECVELGLNHLKEHISTSLINCPQIEFVELNENGIQTKYYAAKPIKKKVNGITYFIYEVYKNKEVYQRFIVLRNNEHEINISIQIDENGMIVPINDNFENISVSFPLVGSSSHILPFYINSSNFEPSTERDALILNGKEMLNGKPTNTGKNRFLLLKSVDLYGELIIILNSIKCQNIYELSRGLSLSYSTFDNNWYQTNFLKSMKEILASNAFVSTAFGKKVILKDAFFPSISIDDEIIPQFISLVSRYCKNIVSVDDAIIWKRRVWNELNIVEIEGLVCEVEVDPSLFNDSKLSFLNELLRFIWKVDRNILYDYYLIPDMNNKLHCLSNERENFDLKESKTVKGQIIEIMESIEINWRTTHMNNKINSISLPEDNIVYAESSIIEKVKEDNSKCFELMKFVLENNEFRENMFYFVSTLNMIESSPIIVKDINPEIWDFADKYVFDQIVKTISEFSCDRVKSLIEFFCKFISVYQSYEKDKDLFSSSQIFPNANCNLKKLSYLKNKNNDFHDHMNPITIKFLEKDLNEEILHPEINKIIKSNEDESLSEILLVLNRKINELKEKEPQLEIAESIICMIPTSNQPDQLLNVSDSHKEKIHDQQKIFTLYHDLINHHINEVQIDSTLYWEINWMKSNEIIIEFICNKIQETETLNNFKETFFINNDEDCFTILNNLYEHSFSFINKYKIIPNKHGIFKLKDELKEDPGIEDDLLECISYLKPNSSMKYELADSRVKISNLSKINILEFYKELNEMFSDALKKPNVSTKVIEMLKKINHIDDSFIDMIASKELTEDQKARISILQNAHIQFISNRLRELDSPSLKDFKRWPFELIQNANDSLVDPSQSKPEIIIDDDKKLERKVKIIFDFSDGKVTFSHDGLPFTNDSLFALLYQCSQGKGENSKSIGKFGTGFLSTHILSREIKFSGDVETRDGVTGFQVTLFRNGKTRDMLKEGVNRMENSLHKNLEKKNWTTFEYILSKDDKNSQQAYDEGLKSLKRNIGPVLIFNPTIESITIKTTKQTFVYSANHEEGNVQTIKVVKTTTNKLENTMDKFILFSSSHRYEDSDVNINCLLQLNAKNNEIMRRIQDFLFISYPLFDSEQHFMSPILINSTKFEPEKERSSIILKAEDTLENSKESLINQFILIHSVELFRQIVNLTLKMKCSKFYNLSSGLRFNTQKNKFLQENFIDKMRDVLLSFPIFKTSSGLHTADKILLPMIPEFEVFADYNPKDKKAIIISKKHYYDFYNLVSQLSIESKSVVLYDCCLEWLKSVWPNFPSMLTINDFIKMISSFDYVSDLKLNGSGNQNDENNACKDDDEMSLTISSCNEDDDNENINNDNDEDYEDKNNDNDDDEDKNNEEESLIKNDKETKNKLINPNADKNVKFVANVIMFIEEMIDCDKIFRENKILINAEGQFVSSGEVHNFNLPQVYIDMLDQVGYDYKAKILHNDIRHLYENKNIIFERFQLKDAIDIVKKKIDSKNAVSFMKYVIKNSTNRSSMFEYTKFFLDESIKEVEINENDSFILSELNVMLSEADIFVFSKIIKKIQTLDIQQNIDFFMKFVIFLRSSISSKEFSGLKIFPNQRFILCNGQDLFIDEIRDEDVKDVLENVLSIDLRSNLLLDQFNNQIMLKEKTKSNISKTILNSPQFKHLLLIEKTDRFSFYSTIFKYSKNGERIKKIMNVLHFFLNYEIVEVDDNDDDDQKWSSELTNEVIKIAADEVSQFISQFSTIMELQSIINNDNNEDNNLFEKQIFENLSFLYEFTNESKIFPNMVKQFVVLDEVNWIHDHQLDGKLINTLLDFLIEFEHSDEIKQKVLHNSIKVHENLQNAIKILDLNFISTKIKKLISEATNKDTDEYEILIFDFLNFVNSTSELKIIFSSLIKDEMEDKMDEFLKFLSQNEEGRKSGYRGEALVYEFLLNSGKFSVVNWMAKSDNETDFSVTLDNGKTYYINENGEHYDIYAEDLDGIKYFIEVKSTSGGNEEKKIWFSLSRMQFDFANKTSDSNSHFVLALVKNVFESPEFLFLTQNNEHF